MLRSVPFRRILAVGVATAALTSLGLTTSASAAIAETGTADASAQIGPASDISLSLGEQSTVQTGNSGSLIFAFLQNPNTAVAATPATAFAAEAYNAANVALGSATVTPYGFGATAIAPGGQELFGFVVPAGTDHLGLTNPSGAAADSIPDPVSGAGPLGVSTDDVGYTTVTGAVNNPTAYPQDAVIAILERNEAGRIIGVDLGAYTSPATIPANGTATFSDDLSPAQTAGVTNYTAVVTGVPDSSVKTTLPAPSGDEPLLLGHTDTIHGYLNTIGPASTAGKLLQFVARSNGVPTVIGTTITGADGAYTFHVVLPANAEYSIVHPSDATTFGTSSGDFYFPLTPVLTVSHLKTKTLTAKKHKTFQITGTFPGFTGEKVYLELRDAHGHYKVVTFTRVSGSGGFTFKGSKLIQSKAGKYTYRVEAQASGLHSDISSTFTVKVS